MGLITAVHRRRPWSGSSSLLLHHKEHSTTVEPIDPIRLPHATAAGHRLRMYLGHRNIVHTTRYTELAPDRFKHFWR
jgi:hypothetical protein